MSIQVGEKAPLFSLPDETGKIHNLSDYRGNPVVLYFYPKDDTPGCTTEACNFRDDYSTYDRAGIVILGISPDSSKSHAKFKAKYHLPFTLLADPEHTVCELYGVWGKKKMMGHEFDGVFRTTFLLDAEGVIKNIYEKVKPAEHSREIMGALEIGE